MKDKLFNKVIKIMTFAIVIMAVCTSLAFAQNKTQNTKTDEKTSIDDFIDGGDTDDKNDDNTKTDDENTDDNNSNVTVKKYKMSQGFACFKDAMEILNNCKGYEIKSYIEGGSMGITQTVNETFIMSQNYYYKQNTGYCSSSLGQTFYRYFYSNDGGNTIYHKSTNKLASDNASPDWSGTTVDKTLTKDEVLNYDGSAMNAFPLLPTSKDEVVGTMNTSYNLNGKKCYAITFQINQSKIPESYVENIRKEGALDYVEITGVKMTFYIDKDTLRIKKFIKEETYKAKKVIEFTCTTTQTSVFVQFDKLIVPTKPQ